MIALRSSGWIAACVAVVIATVVVLRPSAPAQHAPDVAAAVDARDAIETHATAGARSKLTELRRERDRVEREIREHQDDPPR